MVLKVEVWTTEPVPQAESSDGVVLVQLRDTLMQDASAIVISEASVAVAGGTSSWTVALEVNAPAEQISRARLELWAHLDLDADGEVSKGDYVSMQSYPVLLDERDEFRVQVKRV